MPEETVVATATEGGEGTSQTPQSIFDKVRSYLEPVEPQAVPQAVEPSPKVEEPAQTSPAPEPKPEVALSQDDDDDSGLETAEDARKKIERIRKLKDQKKALRAERDQANTEIADLRSEIGELRKKVEQPKDIGLAEETDPEVLSRKLSDAQVAHGWVEERLDSLDTDEDAALIGAELERQGFPTPREGWDRKAVRQQLVTLKGHAKKVIQAAPERLSFLQTEERAIAKVAELFPEMSDEGNEFHQEMQNILTARPWLKKAPDWAMMAAVSALGLQTLKARFNKTAVVALVAAAKPATPKGVPQAPRLPGAPKPVAAPATGVEQLRAKAVGRGASPADRQAYVRQLLGDK